jgi:RNA polymerase sigma-70 factor (ECF subfamily)
MLEANIITADYLERSLLEDLKRGSYAAFHQLYDKYASILYGFVLEMTRSKNVTSELVQDTFIKVWINRESILIDSSFRAFIFKIAKNQLIDAYRKRIKDPIFEDYLFYEGHNLMSKETADSQLDFDEFNKHLARVKEKLTSRQREIFELNKEQGIPASEIARQLNLSEQTVYNQLSLSLQIMKKEMGKYLQLFLLLF